MYNCVDVRYTDLIMENPIYSSAAREQLFTVAECIEILNKFLATQNDAKGKLLNYSTEADLSSIGFLGEYYNLYLSYELENAPGTKQEVRLFVKTIPYQNADMVNMIHKTGILKKETTLYNSFLSELQSYSQHIWCTRCYLTREDLFVMQHIHDLGYEHVTTETSFLDEPHIRAILRGLATMHASSIAYERKHSVKIGDIMQDVLAEFTVHPDVVWYTSGIEAVLAAALEHPKYQADAKALAYIRQELPSRLQTVYNMVNPSPVHRNVFCHRDIWGGNVFYHKERPFETGCIFVDFQLSRYAPPAIDVLMTLYLNCKPQERRVLMTRCCMYYYDCLALELAVMGIDAAAEQLSRAQFMQSLKELELFGATYNCLAATILRLPDNYLKNLKETDPVEFHRYTNVERKDQLLELLHANVEFRAYLFECIDDMLHVVLQ